MKSLMRRFLIAAVLSFCWLSAHAQVAQQSTEATPTVTEKTATQAQKATPTTIQEPQKEATEVLKTEVEKLTEGEFAKKMVGEKERMLFFGYDVFKIDTSQLTPGPIDPASYFISPGDKLLLRVWGQLNLEYELEVTPDLYVNIPEAGRVYLGGQTLQQAEASVVRQMANVYASFIDPNNPANSTARVELTVTRIREVRFLVLGEVNRPGSYTLHPSLANLVYGLAQAGGVKEAGSLREIRVRRGNNALSIDFYDFLLNTTLSESANLR